MLTSIVLCINVIADNNQVTAVKEASQQGNINKNIKLVKRNTEFTLQ